MDTRSINCLSIDTQVQPIRDRQPDYISLALLCYIWLHYQPFFFWHFSAFTAINFKPNYSMIEIRSFIFGCWNWNRECNIPGFGLCSLYRLMNLLVSKVFVLICLPNNSPSSVPGYLIIQSVCFHILWLIQLSPGKCCFNVYGTFKNLPR